jgi:HEAT repeats
MRTTLILMSLAATAVCGPAFGQIKLPPPLSGSYTVDPKGTGERTFLDLETAVRYLSLAGASGNIEIKVAKGTYTGALLFFPVPGLKAEQKIVIRPLGQGAVHVASKGSIVSFHEGAKNIVLDGLSFGASGSAPAISAGTHVTDIEIRHCHFTSATGGNRVIEIQGKQNSRRWNIHHNKFELGGGRSAGIYTQSTYQLQIHHNEFICDGSREPISLWNANKSESTVHDNLFRGRLSGCAMRLDVSGHDVTVTNNIFLVELQGGSDAVIRSNGLRNGVVNRIRHNVFIIRGGGAAIWTRGPIRIDQNVYAVQEGAIGKTKNETHDSLKEWQQAVAESYAVADEADQNSTVAGKKFFQKYAPLMEMIHDFDGEQEAGAELPTAKSRAQLEPKAQLRYLIQVFGEGDPAAIRLAMKLLARHGRRAIVAVPALGKLCTHSFAPIRADAAEALGRIKVGAEIVIPELVKMLGDDNENEDDERVLLAALRTLGSFGHLAAEAASRLEALEKHDLESVRKAAAAARAAVIGARPKR